MTKHLLLSTISLLLLFYEKTKQKRDEKNGVLNSWPVAILVNKVSVKLLQNEKSIFSFFKDFSQIFSVKIEEELNSMQHLFLNNRILSRFVR
jgi:hypothetical protein